MSRSAVRRLLRSLCVLAILVASGGLPSVAQATTASADLSITKSDTANGGTDPVKSGGQIVYTIVVTNPSAQAAGNVTVTDMLPANTFFSSITASGGATCTTPGIGQNGQVSCSAGTAGPSGGGFTLVLTVTTTASSGSTISNTATLTSQTPDPNMANNSATQMTGVSGTASADVTLTKTDSPDPVKSGGQITYTISVQNSGPDPGANATMTDTLPANTFFSSAAASGGAKCVTPGIGQNGLVTCQAPIAGFTLTLVVTTTQVGGTISNTASVTTQTADPNSANNTATSITTVTGTASANASVVKTDSPDPADPGGQIVYTISVQNAGPDAAANTIMTDPLPANTFFSSLTGPATATCTTPGIGQNGLVTCKGGSAGFTLTLTITVADTATGTISNTATITSATADPDSSNNSSTATTSLTPTAATVTSLAASRTRAGVLVRWRAASEVRLLGYRVYREVGARRVAVSGLISSAANPAGRAYSWVDRKPSAAKGVRYWLRAIGLDGRATWYGPVRARTERS